MNFDTLLNNNKPQDKQFRDTRFFLGHINRVPRGLTVVVKTLTAIESELTSSEGGKEVDFDIIYRTLI